MAVVYGGCLTCIGCQVVAHLAAIALFCFSNIQYSKVLLKWQAPFLSNPPQFLQKLSTFAKFRAHFTENPAYSFALVFRLRETVFASPECHLECSIVA